MRKKIISWHPWMKRGIASMMALTMCVSIGLPINAISKDIATAHLSQAEKAAIEEQNNVKKINTIVSTDGEHDDMASMIRYLTMANEFNTKAIVLTSSAAGHHTGGNITYPDRAAVDALTDTQKGYIKDRVVDKDSGEVTEEGAIQDNADGTVTVTFNQNRWTGFRWINYYIEKYGEVYDNLKVHDEDYPTEEYLKSVLKYGNVKVVGDMQEVTEGSEYIKKLILENPDGEPLYIQHWGGANTTARALKSIEEEYKGTAEWDRIVKKINSEVTLYMIWGRQAPTYASYIKPSWPGIRTIVNEDQFFSFYTGFSDKTRTDQDVVKKWYRTEWGKTILDIGSPLTSLANLDVPYDYSKAAINNPDSPFYTEPIYDASHGQSEEDNFPWDTWGDSGSVNTKKGWGSNQTDKTEADYTRGFKAEGDTPSYFFIMNNGLRSYEDPDWGGWAGRFAKVGENEYTEAVEDPSLTPPNPWMPAMRALSEDKVPEGSTVSPGHYTFSRWAADFQAEYSAHAKWTVTSSYKNANHHPKAGVVNGLDLDVTPGQVLKLDGAAYDPDGDELTYKWWRYADVDSYKGEGTIDIANTEDTEFTVPADAKVGDTIHLIFEVSDAKDNDTYTSLKNYKRVVLTVTEPKKSNQNTQINTDKTNTVSSTVNVVNNAELKVTQKNNKIIAQWEKIPEAENYDVYVKKGNNKYKLAASVTGTTAKIGKLNGKSVNQKATYKIIVKANKIVDGKKVVLAKTNTAYLVGKKNVKYTNVKKIVLSHKKYTLKAGKTAKIKVKLVKENTKKKLDKLSGKLRYVTSDTAIATVSKNGKISSKSKGVCTVYVFAANGISKAIKVRVK